MRCQIHAELAVIEEEAERLEPAMQHLHTALDLDESGQFQQRLSFSLHLLQLRSKLYSTPTRPEDQAAMLIQQVWSLACYTIVLYDIISPVLC